MREAAKAVITAFGHVYLLDKIPKFYLGKVNTPANNPLAEYKHVSKILSERQELAQSIEAAARLGATPTQIREIAAELAPLMLPSAKEVNLAQVKRPSTRHQRLPPVGPSVELRAQQVQQAIPKRGRG